MARPRKKITKPPVNLTIDPVLIHKAKALAYEKGTSLSEMVEGLLGEEVARYQGNVRPMPSHAPPASLPSLPRRPLTG
jgi:hypothetical protein